MNRRKTCMSIMVLKGSNLDDVVTDITGKYGIVKV